MHLTHEMKERLRQESLAATAKREEGDRMNDTITENITCFRSKSSPHKYWVFRGDDRDSVCLFPGSEEIHESTYTLEFLKNASDVSRVSLRNVVDGMGGWDAGLEEISEVIGNFPRSDATSQIPDITGQPIDPTISGKVTDVSEDCDDLVIEQPRPRVLVGSETLRVVVSDGFFVEKRSPTDMMGERGWTRLRCHSRDYQILVAQHSMLIELVGMLSEEIVKRGG